MMTVKYLYAWVTSYPKDCHQLVLGLMQGCMQMLLTRVLKASVSHKLTVCREKDTKATAGMTVYLNVAVATVRKQSH